MSIISGLRRMLRFPSWRPPKSPGQTCAILIYHRVADLERDPQLLAVSPSNFRDQMEVLTSTATPISSSQLNAGLDGHDLDKPRVCVTFDDGYSDNFHFARPVLLHYGIPATVFACSKISIDQRPYWWDILEYSILGSTGEIRLDLTATALGKVWHLSGDGRRNPCWSILSPDDPTPRHSVYRELMVLVKRLSPASQQHVIEQLIAQTGFVAAESDIGCAMTPEELRSFADTSLLSVGAHTREHCQLSLLQKAEQTDQINGCRKDLERILERPVEEFSYPYGAAGDYDATSINILREGGFSRAYANFPGLFSSSAPRFETPRILIRNVAGDQFAAQLKALFN